MLSRLDKILVDVYAHSGVNDKILVDVYAHSGVNGLITLYAMFFHVLYNNLTFTVFVKTNFPTWG